ncbi:MAG TPA: SMC-Scp complex subunit ScpB, partial [Saprospiraceae bacterium]|nr:SMC-Scp complex subunit ScpB [Saprospiraceae bacterium]
EFAIEVVEVAEGFQFMTKPAFHPIAGHFLKQLTKRRLSKVALETLSIIAYKQPVSRAEIEQIRGVNADYAIDKLLEKELIEIAGRSTGPGKPLLYTTSGKFMDYFGLKSMEDLPQLKEFLTATEEIGEPAPLEEMVGQNEMGDENNEPPLPPAVDESE